MNYFKSIRFRKGGLAFIFIAVILAVIVLINAVVMLLADRVDLSYDVTAGGDYTLKMDDNYSEFIKKIEKPVTVTVCAKQSDFEDSIYANQMVNSLSLSDALSLGYASDNTSKYARQVGIFLEDFNKLNDKISISYKNPNSETEFKAVSDKYSGESLAYGDIIINCTTNAGEKNESERYNVIKMSDYFSITEDSDYAEYAQYYGTTYNTIVGSDLAGSLTSAFYTVTSESTEKITVLTGYSSGDYSNLETFLKKNNYDFKKIESIDQEIDKESDTILIYGPQKDFTKAEIEALDSYLSNDENLGKNLIYIPDPLAKVNSLPNLEEYLKEWGIEFCGGFVCEPDQNNYYYYPYYITAQSAKSEYTTTLDEGSLTYPFGGYSAIKAAFTEKGYYATTSILKSSEDAILYPYDADENWSMEKQKASGPYDLALLSSLTNSEAAAESKILVIGGTDFFGSDILEEQIYGGKKYLSESFANATLLLKLVNGMTGAEESTAVEIKTKSIEDNNFYEKISESNTPKIVGWLFICAIPVLLIGTGMFVWAVRKRR